MRRIVSFIGAGVVVALAGVAFGVSAPTGALDALSSARPHAAGRREPFRLPTTPMEVELALKAAATEKVQLAGIEEELGRIEVRLLARGRTYYKHVRAGLLPAGGGFEELVDHAARVERTRLSLTRDLESAKQLRKRRGELDEGLARNASQLGPLEAQKKAFDSARSVTRLADERRVAFDRAFDSSTAPPDYVAIYGADLGPSDSSAVKGFASLKGHLPFPMAGRAEVRKLEGSMSAPAALELHAAAGASARAVAGGRVVFSDRYEGELLTVIIDHGNRYFTVYGNLTATEVKVAEDVTTGAALGSVVNRKGESVLYFELREEGRPVDPSPWLGL
jgi:murein hydrolase activator